MMDISVVLSLLQAIVALVPEIEQVIPIVEAIVDGKVVTAAQAAQLWSVIAQLEAMNASKVAAVEAGS
jgi:hypothetical protein